MPGTETAKPFSFEDKIIQCTVIEQKIGNEEQFQATVNEVCINLLESYHLICHDDNTTYHVLEVKDCTEALLNHTLPTAPPSNLSSPALARISEKQVNLSPVDHYQTDKNTSSCLKDAFLNEIESQENCSSYVNDGSQCYELFSEFSEFYAQWTFWIKGVGIFNVGLFGLAGNFLTIIVLRKSTEANRHFNKLLIALAIVDSLLIVDLVVESSILLFLGGELPLWYIFSYSYFIHPAKGMVQTATIYMVVAVSAERYKAICHPLR